MNNISPQGAFTQCLWNSVEPIFEQIINCSFVTDLAEGTLSFESFAHYLSQDVLYLRQDNEALELAAKRATIPAHKLLFQQIANDGIAIENLMHKEYLFHFGIKESNVQSPVFKAYGEFLLQKAQTALFPIAAAALLPCFWIYGKTGEYIRQNQKAENPYQKFIDTYSGEEYDLYTRQFIVVVEQLGKEASETVQKAMLESFIQSTRFELLVFEEAANIYR